MNSDDSARVEIGDDLIAFGLPEGRGDFVCCPLDTLEELIELEKKIDLATAPPFAWLRVVIGFVGERMPKDTPPLTLGQAENLLHALKVARAKKKTLLDDDLNAARGLPSFTDSTPAD